MSLYETPTSVPARKPSGDFSGPSECISPLLRATARLCVVHSPCVSGFLSPSPPCTIHPRAPQVHQLLSYLGPFAHAVPSAWNTPLYLFACAPDYVPPFPSSVWARSQSSGLPLLRGLSSILAPSHYGTHSFPPSPPGSELPESAACTQYPTVHAGLAHFWPRGSRHLAIVSTMTGN